MTMTDEMTTDGGDNGNNDNGNEDGGGANRWMWHAGAVAKLMTSTLAIYCPPSNANRVLKVRLNSGGIVEDIGPNLPNLAARIDGTVGFWA